MSYHDAMVSITPEYLCCNPPGLVLGSLYSNSALVLVVNLLFTLLLTVGNNLFVRREQHWVKGGGGCLKPHPQSAKLPPHPLREKEGALEA